MFIRDVQYQGSGHYLNGNYAYANRADCADCHTHEGFLARLAGGWGSGTAVDNPSPPNCRTCHKIHETYTRADYALRTTSPVDLLYPSGATVDFGEGNLCASCHMSRTISPMPAIGGPNVSVTSSRYGGHHSPVADILGGKGLFAFTGSQTINQTPFIHGSKTVGCPVCHMAPGYGNEGGGHTLNMEYDSHGTITQNTTGCQTSGCHSALTGGFNYGNVQSDVQTKLDSLATLLRKAGIMAAAPSVSSKSGSFPGDVAAAFVNWQLIAEDKSLGVHNPPYVTRVLQNTIEKLNTIVK